MIKIEKGVPLPERLARRGMKCPYPFDQMEEGDSFVLPVASNDTAKRAVARVSMWARKVSQGAFSVACRTDPDGKAIRVWRVAPKPARGPYKRKPKPLAGIAAQIGAVKIHRLADDPEPAKRGRPRKVAA